MWCCAPWEGSKSHAFLEVTKWHWMSRVNAKIISKYLGYVQPCHYFAPCLFGLIYCVWMVYQGESASASIITWCIDHHRHLSHFVCMIKTNVLVFGYYLSVPPFWLSFTKMVGQFGSNVVYVSYIQGGNIYVSLRKIQ